MVNELINPENLFLVGLALVWIVGAVFQDLKRREVDNLWNFSLIAFALSYRLFISVFTDNPWFVLNGIFGLLVFLGLGNLFYFLRLFAGGDAKLLIALGTILPLSFSWIINLKIFAAFILLFLLTGSVYALLYAFFLITRNWGKFQRSFAGQWGNYKNLFLIALIFAFAWILISFFASQAGFVFIGLIVLLFPVLFVFAKAVEESCLIKKVNWNEVTEGDWLCQGTRIKNKTIEARWEGLSKKEIEMIRKSRKKVFIKYGIPFTPSFFLGFVCLLILMQRFGNLF